MDEPQSRKRPENLPPLEVLRDGGSGGRSMGGGGGGRDSMRGSGGGSMIGQRGGMDMGGMNFMNKSSSLRGTPNRNDVSLRSL